MLNGLGTVLYLSLFLLTGEASQIAFTPAVCESGHDWMFNSLGQSPCEVAAYLTYPCSAPNASSIPAAGPGQFYASSIHNSCVCNTVIFSLLTACSACQGAGIEAWQYWSAVPVGCTNAFDQEYPQNIPPGIKVPHWAYLPLDDGNYLAASASAIGGLPESTGTPTSTATNPPFTVAAVVANGVAAAPAPTTTTSTPPPTTSSATHSSPPDSPFTNTPAPNTNAPSPNLSSSPPTPSAPSSASDSSQPSTSASPTSASISTSISTFVSGVVSNITTQISGQPTTFLTTSLSTSLSTSLASETPALTQTSGGVHNHSDTGAIIGGVLGGLAALLVLAGGAYYLWSRRGVHFYSGPEKADLATVSEPSIPPSYNYGQRSGPAATLTPQRLYDPDDPSTFPDALMTQVYPSMGQTASDRSDSGLLAYGHGPVAQV